MREGESERERLDYLLNFKEATFVAADDAEVNLGVGRAGVVRVHSPAGNYGA